MDLTMGEATELILKDFRCLSGEQRGKLRAITLLVGENSTGKSSFMAGYMAIAQCFKEQTLNDEPDFNQDPFELGSFNDIVYAVGKENSNPREFRIGVGFGNAHPEINVSFRQKNALPHVHNLSYRFSETDFIEFGQVPGGANIKTPEFSIMSRVSLTRTYFFVKLIADELDFSEQNRSNSVINALAKEMIESNTKDFAKEIIPIANYLKRIARKYPTSGLRDPSFNPRDSMMVAPSIRETIAIAPIRSKPKRTYDPIREFPNPEGDHMPMMIMRLSKANSKYWNKFRHRLNEFGNASALFSDIRIKNYGDESNDPFQVQVKVRSGKFINIMDVGYGVSQSLPLVVNILYHCLNGSAGNSVFLLQQPEAHMHPRAQAELSNFVCNEFKVSGNRFVIETHSDFIVDRMRLMVRHGVVNRNDVSIVYFEPHGSSVELHNIELDEDGNLQNCPTSYRQFFLKEIDKLVGIE